MLQVPLELDRGNLEAPLEELDLVLGWRLPRILEAQRQFILAQRAEGMTSFIHALILVLLFVARLPLHLAAQHLVARCAETATFGALYAEAADFLICQVACVRQPTNRLPPVPDPLPDLTPECSLYPYARLDPALLCSLLLFSESEHIQNRIEM